MHTPLISESIAWILLLEKKQALISCFHGRGEKWMRCVFLFLPVCFLQSIISLTASVTVYVYWNNSFSLWNCGGAWLWILSGSKICSMLMLILWSYIWIFFLNYVLCVLPHLISQYIVYSYNHMQYPKFFTISADTTYVYQDREGKKAKLGGFLC